MNMKRIVILTLSLFWLLSPVAVFAENSEQAYQKARDAYYSLQDSSRKQMYRENWENVYDKFESVYQRFPKTRRGADSLYMCGKTMAGLYAVSRIKPDAQRSVELFVQMAETYPDSSLADDALLQAGKLMEEVLADKSAAYALYKLLVEAQPKGDMAGKAKARLAALAPYAPADNAVDAKPLSDAKAAADTPQSTVAAAPAKTSAGSRTLSSIRYWSNPGYTRIVLDVSSQTKFSAHYLVPEPSKGAPPRLYVDIEKTALAEGLNEKTAVDDGLLRQIRTGSPQSDTVRVVLDLESIGDYKVFPLSDPWRIVIDVAGDKSPELKRRDPEISSLPDSGGDAIAKVLNETPKDQKPLHIPKAPATSTLRRIVVDAGHGGKDPGAVGKSGTLEKDVTLQMAKALSKELTRQIGCEVILTRSGDVYLPLEERTAIANKVGADLFISLHANANNNRKAFGIETYYLNFSKNDKAAAVAARENGTSIKQVSDLELILFDLMANAKINESSRLATVIQEGLVKGISKKYSDVRDLGVRQGPFYVLLGATMPSVLVETAFISHPREEKRLRSSAFQNSAAKAIAAAIKDYAVNNKLIATR
ncbi:N-acetylmuramoyl-L-alanine amidase [Deltaproteobacteria bacterium IMCC39524]|nr:N-acetylmuramoyl-L-alanine amidase [Deltaproteobacteria bacterium IMCC39524]